MFRLHGILIMLLLYQLGGLLGWHDGPIVEFAHATAMLATLADALFG